VAAQHPARHRVDLAHADDAMPGTLEAEAEPFDTGEQ
jgi:hypothetical protein